MAEKMWVLKNRTTGEVLEGPMPLPENWGPIFGLNAVKDKIGNLDWLGNKDYPEHGWVETDTDVPENSEAGGLAEKAKKRAKALLSESDWAMLSDVPMTVGVKQQWIDYRTSLREIHTQAGFPNNIVWPVAPE